MTRVEGGRRDAAWEPLRRSTGTARIAAGLPAHELRTPVAGGGA